MLALLLLGCRRDSTTCDHAAQQEAPAEAGIDGDNVLVLILDDVGVDKLGVYGVHERPADTPRLDALFTEGVRFDRAYASPTCSPTRASILTGRHPSRHGVGEWIWPSGETYSLPESELTLAEVARDAGWSTAAVGKWHLSSVIDRPDAGFDPLRQGFDHFHGLIGNPTDAVAPDGEHRGYAHWERIDDGESSYSDAYLTSVQIDDTLDVVRTLPEPWVTVVGLSAAHVPLDRPPRALAVPASDAMPDLYDAVLEALDVELGRLLDGMGDDLRARTTIVTIGDNGTPEHAVRPPWSAAESKTTVTEGGVRVPLAVTGPLVTQPGTVSRELVHATDVFATVADLVGADVRELPVVTDGTSLIPRLDGGSGPGSRRCLLVEQFEPDGDVARTTLDRAVIEADAKLARSLGEPDVLTRVGTDPSAEAPLDDGPARRRLKDELRAYERSLD